MRSGDSALLRSGLSHYSRTSLGGGATAARRFGLAAQAGGALFGLLTGGGQPDTEPPLDLEGLVGGSVDEAIEAIVDVLAAGGAQDEQAIRDGMSDALSQCLASYEEFDAGVLSEDTLAELFQGYITEEIVIRVHLDSGDAFVKSDDPVRCVEAENELRDYVRSVVDVVAGTRLRTDLSELDAAGFEGLLTDVFREVIDEFGSYE